MSYASGATGFANQSYGYGGYGGSEGSYENPTGYGYVGSGPNSNIGGEELQNEVVVEMHKPKCTTDGYQKQRSIKQGPLTKREQE